MTRAMTISIFAGVLSLTVGCRNTSERPALFGRHHDSAKKSYVAPGAPTPLANASCPPSGSPSGAFPVVPTNPPNGAFPIVPPAQQPPTFAPKPPADPTNSRLDPFLRPTEAREPARDPRIQLYAPETVDKEKIRPTDEPPAVKKQDSQTVKKQDSPIAQFATAKENAYAGLPPQLAGLDWLQTKGVKTIVHVRLFGEDDALDRKEAEARDMRYVAFEISPVVLTKEKAEEFIKLIRDGAKQGIFVYDKDGSLAGAMWYLHLRSGESYDDETSQLRARPLGLDVSREGQHRDMWLAVQKLQSENNP